MLTGRIVADAQKQVTSGGREYITFRLGNNEFNDEKGSDGKPITYWFRITSWNQAHINLAKYLTKGKPIIVVGSYKDNIYQNTKTGNCEIGRDIIADSIDFVNDGTSGQNTAVNTTSISSNKAQTEAIPEVTSSTTSPTKSTTVNVTTHNVSDDDDDLPF